MTIRYAPHLLALILASTTLIGCSSGGGDSTPTTPSYTVTTSLLGGTATPSNPSVKEGGSAIITLTADEGYTLDAASVTGCDGVLVGNIYTTGPINVACTVTAGFVPTAGVAQVTLGYGIKQLKFTWSAVSGASYYQLQEQATSGAGYTQVGVNLTQPSATRDIPVHLHDWVNASYMVRAYNDSGEYLDSNVVTTTLAEAVNPIGYIKASNTDADDEFGYSVALSGDGNTLAVGAYVEASGAKGIDGDQTDNTAPNAGAVYVYTRDADGLWAQHAYIKASDALGDDTFGQVVALSKTGDTLAVSAKTKDSGGINASGAAYLFSRTDGVWSERQKLTSPSPVALGFFGDVMLSDNGGTLAVAEPGAQKVYLYTLGGTGWALQDSVTGLNTEPGDSFASWSYALSGNGITLAIGARGEDGSTTLINGIDDNAGASVGAAYIFTPDGTGKWTQQAYIKAPNAEDSDLFGSSVGLSDDGNTLVVGASGEDGAINDVSTTNAGALYAFTRDAAGAWSHQDTFRADIPNSADSFASGSLALSSDGSLVAVSATMAKVGTTVYAGAVYLFRRDEFGAWSQQAYITAPNAGLYDYLSFGRGVALSDSGDVLAIGAEGDASSAKGVCVTWEASCAAAQQDILAPYAGAVYLY